MSRLQTVTAPLHHLPKLAPAEPRVIEPTAGHCPGCGTKLDLKPGALMAYCSGCNRWRHPA